MNLDIPAQFAADLTALRRKKQAELSGGWYHLGMRVHRGNSSRYRASFVGEDDDLLIMGCVQAVLALLAMRLFGVQVAALPTGLIVGEARILSLSVQGRTQGSYRVTWHLEQRQARYGGFPYGTTYHLPLVHLLASLVTAYVPALLEQAVAHEELLERWGALLRLLDTEQPRTAQGWTDAQIGAACRISTVQDALEAVCDALWFDLRYSLPRQETRQITLVRESSPLITPLEDIQWVTLESLLTSPPRLIRKRPRGTRLPGGVESPCLPAPQRRLGRLGGDDLVLADDVW